MPETRKPAPSDPSVDSALEKEKSVINKVDTHAIIEMMDDDDGPPGHHIMEPSTEQKGYALASLSRYSPIAGRYLLHLIQHHPPEHCITMFMDAATGEKYNVPMQVVLGTYKSDLAKSHRRLTHALKRLKEKGLYARNLTEMTKIAVSKDFIEVIKMIQLLYCHVGALITISEADTGIEFTDADYLTAIDMAMFLYKPDRFHSSEVYAPILMDALPHIYFNVLAYHYIITMNDTVRRQSAAMSELATETEQFGGLRQTISDIQERLQAGDQTWQEKINQQLEQFNKERQGLTEKLQAATRRAETAETRNKPLEQKLQDAQLKLESLRQERDKLKQNLKAAEKEHKAAIHQAKALRDELDLYRLPTLPENRVTFVGGSVNMVKKLSQQHPGWTFIDDDSPDKFDIGTVELILCYTGHLAHKRFNRMAGTARQNGIPVVYIPPIVNLKKLDLEIRRAYDAILHPQGEAP